MEVEPLRKMSGVKLMYNWLKENYTPGEAEWLSVCFKRASRELGFDFNVNTHSMRKTFGYHAYEGGADIHYLQALFNHSNSHVTLRYIGVTKPSIRQMYFDNTMDIA